MRRRVLLVFIVVTAVRVIACTSTTPADAEARLAYLGERIEEDSLPGLAPGEPFAGEWKLVTLSMAVMAAANLGFTEPTTRPTQRARARRWIERMLADDVRATDRAQWGGRDALDTLASPEGHAGYLGHLAVAMGAACLLGSGSSPLHAQVVAALARRIDASPDALIETYPSERYVPDNVVVAAGVALFGRCRGGDPYGAMLNRWRVLMRERYVDATTGVLVFTPGGQARGSGAGWNALFLPLVDEALAASQRDAVRTHFEARWFGLRAVREWPHGSSRGGDVDSGPLVFGLSPAASGMELAALVRDGFDPARARAALRTAELVGVSWGLTSRRYLFAPLVGDALVLAARTATRWPQAAMVAE